MSNKKLIIISDTRIQNINGTIYGFPSVVLELNIFVNLFEQIHWIVVDDSLSSVNESFLPIPKNISLHHIPDLTLKGRKSKFNLLLEIIKTFFKVSKLIQGFDVIHVRGPNPIMLISLVISRINRKKLWWFKYANNWVDTTGRPFWKVQKFLLQNSPYSVVTLNGTWPNEPKYIKSFENPCLSEAEVNDGRLIIKSKSYKKSINLLFVGRLEFQKGVGKLLEWLENNDNSKIGQLYIVGGGKNQDYFLNIIKNNSQLRNRVVFVGTVNRVKLIEYYKMCHFLILPTFASEGFPKVIAEASAYGCIPVSTSVSCIQQYIRHGINGYDWETWRRDSADILENDDLNNIGLVANNMSRLFTYERYQIKLKEILFNGN
jgi:glycosyltransferase involved in cell wall biosynthesis